MSNTKTCPFCDEEIRVAAVKCKHCGEFLNGSSSRSSVGSSPSIPNKVGAYQILCLIGKGGMGTVYRGRHRSEPMAERQGGDVCIKTMHPQYADDPVFQRRFEREAALGLKLNHPGLVKVHDLVMDAGTLALVMEYVEGRSLAEMIGTETGPIPWARAWPMFSQLLAAVGHAHEHGIIHRDLKPENVMVTPDGQLKILDFGIAKESGSGATRTGAGIGTADYMAPEQHTDAKNVDQCADIYALGMTLYEMLAGRLPWGEELDLMGMLMCKQNGDIPPPTKFYQWIPPGVVAGMMSALSPGREARPASTGAFRQVLDGAGRAPAAGPTAAAPGPAHALVETAPRPPHASPPEHRPYAPAVKPAPTTVGITTPKPGRFKIIVAVVAVALLLLAIYVVSGKEDPPLATRSSPTETVAEKPQGKDATEKRAAEKRAAEKRAAEKRAAEKRAAEKQAARKREARKREARKREARKRTARKRAAEKREAEKREARKREAEKREARKREARKREARKRPSGTSSKRKRWDACMIRRCRSWGPVAGETEADVEPRCRRVLWSLASSEHYRDDRKACGGRRPDR